MENVHPLVIEYHKTVLDFQPPAFAKMNEPGAQRKYTKIYRRLSYPLLQTHLRGDITLAACLINTAGSARAAVLDIDSGGEAALLRVLSAATDRQLIAFAQSSTNDEHDGGHVWILFDGWRDPARFRSLADTLADAASVDAETYPTRKSIRLPLGVHRWTGKRGRLFLPGSTALDLDEGEHAVRHAIRAIRALPQNAIAALPELPKRLPRPLSHTPLKRSAAPGETSDVIHDYNHSTNLVGLLEGFGGRIAEYLPRGSILMHCPCPHHKHGDARPSIELRPAKNRARYGEFVVYGYAPGCAFHTERGQVVDAFGVYCQLNNYDPDEAVKQLGQE